MQIDATDAIGTIDVLDQVPELPRPGQRWTAPSRKPIDARSQATEGSSMRPLAFATNPLAPQPYPTRDFGGQLGSLIDAIEDSAQPVCIYRAKRYLYANRAYATMLGFNATDELLQLTNIISLVHPEDRPMAGTATRARLAGQYASTRHEFRMLRREG